jgi:hypothetical protein
VDSVYAREKDPIGVGFLELESAIRAYDDLA